MISPSVVRSLSFFNLEVIVNKITSFVDYVFAILKVVLHSISSSFDVRFRFFLEIFVLIMYLVLRKKYLIKLNNVLCWSCRWKLSIRTIQHRS